MMRVVFVVENPFITTAIVLGIPRSSVHAHNWHAATLNGLNPPHNDDYIPSALN